MQFMSIVSASSLVRVAHRCAKRRLSEAFCFNLFACQLGAFSLHAHYVLS